MPILEDNLDPQEVENQDPQAEAPVVETPVEPTSASWKSNLAGDLGKSPLLNKFEDTPEGLNKAFESHVNLEKLLGHDKVPIPKGPDDVEGWSKFSKALGIPDKAENYGLADAAVPDSMKGVTFDKQKFAELMHSFKATPAQAKGLWQAYTEQTKEAYSKAMESHKADMDKVVNQLKSEWGDAYDSNVELGQMVINKFSSDQESADYITSVLTKDPKAIKFLAKIGEQFAENKIGEFSYKRFSLSPEQAQNEIDTILKNPKHAYNDPAAGDQEHRAAIDYVNNLYSTINKAKG